MASEAGEIGEPKSYWGMAARECDSCKRSPALLFCRADSAFLCGGCDARVHGANKLASRHERVWMCEVCEQAPASVTCKADAAALCFTCDSDIHSANPLSRRHDRVPIVPFYDSPAATGALKSAGTDHLLKPSDDDDVAPEAEAASWLLPDPTTNIHPKVAVEAPELKPDGYFFSDIDPYLDLDYASSMDARFHQTDSLVPVQTKTTAAAAAHPPAFVAPDGCIDLDFTGSKASYASYTTAPSLSHSVSSSEVGVVPDGSGMTEITNPYGRGGSASQMTQLSGLDREARVLRYREKRKNRKFEKTIRYASRKAYAETRPRIKGRFAKRTEIETEVDRIYSSAGLLVESGYGVVPSY